MPMQFDATVKELAQENPQTFVQAFDPMLQGPVTLLNVDLSTVTTSADLVFGVGEPVQKLIHVEVQSGPDEDLPQNVLVYNALLHRRSRLPVHSIVLLMRRQAQHPSLTGLLQYEGEPGRGRLEFCYEVVRLWERPVESILDGPLNLLPLATLCQLPAEPSLETGLSQVIQKVVERLQREGSEQQVRKLVTATFVFMGLRVSRTTAREIFRGVQIMSESVSLLAVLDEGEVRGLHKAILRVGRKRFGEPDEATKSRLLAITDIDQLEVLTERILDVNSWEELLGQPGQ